MNQVCYVLAKQKAPTVYAQSPCYDPGVSAGRGESCTDSKRELTPVGENDGPLHRNDSTFGEYMASLNRKSSSSLNRKLSGPGIAAFCLCDALLTSRILLRQVADETSTVDGMMSTECVTAVNRPQLTCSLH